MDGTGGSGDKSGTDGTDGTDGTGGTDSAGDTGDLVVDHDRGRQRYTLLAGGRPVAFADYRLVADGAVAVFHHTVTEPAHRGRGLAAHLVACALDDVRAAERTVTATCWYVDEFIRDHPDYHDLRA